MSNPVYRLSQHQAIHSVLECFDATFFIQNRIMFGGGTRIALQFDEFRESIDVDLFCPDKESYRAVRNTVLSNSLGQLVLQDFTYLREIRFDRDKVVCFLKHQGSDIKLEILSCDSYSLVPDVGQLFPIPYFDLDTCFYTKLLANSDRCRAYPYKDIVDILMLFRHLRHIPLTSIQRAESHYGDVVKRDLLFALEHVRTEPQKYHQTMASLSISQGLITELLQDVCPQLIQWLPQWGH
ncbi:nucleotidyl transferase AbiEii/AbiGii toxin family protein [Rheinheimera texasensis]|uniref:nucleotidyl transferase AbiEii/AbiGii toxin family protein n=1 Tax=Rheinheimera texasensis TaxID=306205 RepID=UPI0032B2DA81